MHTHPPVQYTFQHSLHMRQTCTNTDNSCGTYVSKLTIHVEHTCNIFCSCGTYINTHHTHGTHLSTLTTCAGTPVSTLIIHMGHVSTLTIHAGHTLSTLRVNVGHTCINTDYSGRINTHHTCRAHISTHYSRGLHLYQRWLPMWVTLVSTLITHVEHAHQHSPYTWGTPVNTHNTYGTHLYQHWLLMWDACVSIHHTIHMPTPVSYTHLTLPTKVNV